MNKNETNKKVFLLVVLILLFSLLSGCLSSGNNEDIKYVTENNKNNYVIFYNNGEFNAFSPNGDTASGTYRLTNNEYILTYRPFGNIIKLKHITNGNMDYIEDNKGYKWVRE